MAKMKSSIKSITGEAHYVKLFEDDRDMMAYNTVSGAYDLPSPHNGTYICGIVISEEDHRRLRVEGNFNVGYSKMQHDGRELISFKRKHEARDRKGDIMDWNSGAPKVMDMSGKPWSKDEQGIIWNGSKLEVTYEEFGEKNWSRLVSVKVLELADEPEREPDTSLMEATGEAATAKDDSDKVPF